MPARSTPGSAPSVTSVAAGPPAAVNTRVRRTLFEAGFSSRSVSVMAGNAGPRPACNRGLNARDRCSRLPAAARERLDQADNLVVREGLRRHAHISAAGGRPFDRLRMVPQAVPGPGFCARRLEQIAAKAQAAPLSPGVDPRTRPTCSIPKAQVPGHVPACACGHAQRFRCWMIAFACAARTSGREDPTT